MAFGINNELQNFFNFAVQARKSGQAAEATQGGEVRAASRTACALSRSISSSADTQAAININNHVRETFVNALKKQFNVEDFTSLPQAVKDALVGSHASTAEEDFGFNEDGHVTSGKPLTARRIKAVMVAINRANVDGEKLTVNFAPEMQGLCTFRGSAKTLTKISPYIATENLKNAKVFSKKVNAGMTGPDGDKMYGQAVASCDGLLTRDDATGAPKNFVKDFPRVSQFILPGVGKVSYRPNEVQKAINDITTAVTQGRIRHFADLTGNDLKKVRFVMSLMNQTIINAASLTQTQAMFRTDSEGGSISSFGKTNGQISIEIVIDNDGGITIKGSNKIGLETFIGLLSEDLENCPDEEVMVNLDPQKSYSKATIELHYSPKKLNKIVSADWDNLPAQKLMKLVEADTRTFGGNLNLEE